MKTLKTLIAERGINERHAVTLLNRRARHAMTRDRTKFYASTPLNRIPWVRNIHETSADLATLRMAASDRQLISTAQYVAAWCRLNHLTEC
jgi:AraC-like DNA-binding protein